MILGSVLYTKPEALGANSAISALTAKTTLQGDDLIAIVDTAGTYTTKKISVTNATTSMKAYNDTIYSAIFSTSAGLAALLSDETGSGGGFVRATNPTVTSLVVGTTATITDPHFDVSGTEAVGDLFYVSDAGGTLTRLPVGSSNEFLRVSSGIPDWDNTALLTNPQTSSSTFTASTTFTHDVLFASSTIGITNIQTFTSSGQWVKPTGLSANSVMMIELWGGGGGGGGTTGGASGISGGGGGGGYIRHYMPASTATSSVLCRVGSGGTGGASGANSGTAGGNTLFGTYVTAYGGGGGGYGNGAGNNGSGGGGGGLSGAGGTGSNGGGVTSGGGYGAITTGSQDGFAGGFGASASAGTAYGNANWGGGGGSTANSDIGGASVYGGGGGNAGTSVFGGAGGSYGNNTNASNGTAPGGGGGGVANAGSNWAGGNGAAGQCRITTWK